MERDPSIRRIRSDRAILAIQQDGPREASRSEREDYFYLERLLLQTTQKCGGGRRIIRKKISGS